MNLLVIHEPPNPKPPTQSPTQQSNPNDPQTQHTSAWQGRGVAGSAIGQKLAHQLGDLLEKFRGLWG